MLFIWNGLIKVKGKKVVTFVGDGVLHLLAFVTLVGVVTFVGATNIYKAS